MPGLTIQDPVLFSAVLASQNILPGDVILLADGIYRGDFTLNSSINGLPGNPVKIMPRHPGKVVIDGTFRVFGDYVEIYDIDFTDSRSDRYLYTQGIMLDSIGGAIYGCSICDIHNTGVRWSLQGPGDISENIIYNNGYRTADTLPHGYAIYGLNNLGGLKTIARNIFFAEFGKYTIHLYTGDQYLKDFHVIDNILCGDALHTGGGYGMSNFAFNGNWQYQYWAQLGRYSDPGTNQDATVLNNTLIQLSSFLLYDFQTVTAAGNQVYEIPNFPYTEGYTQLPLPATLTRIIPYTKSKRWLGALAIFNRDAAPFVPVDFSSLLAPGSYRLRNGQNISETWAFETSGSPVQVPTAFTSAPRIGDDPTISTWPYFGALVIEVV